MGVWPVLSSGHPADIQFQAGSLFDESGKMPEFRTHKMELIVQTEIVCPHCGEFFPIQVDTCQATQSLIEDCAICCCPITLTIRCQPGAIVDLSVL